ncbi:hypothetical protein [Mycobacteroides abscessus]|uniref:hypothetical protein n=1 Tax=Mycobacteroides abscessus TaxID=36809 RepID=UPI000925D560|nr:hypothetical protein [Mycobacteroides abscessus]SIE27072.1 Uncharacterised protein [Mycobacteroides abscessus subsp. abscessus]SIE51132.1 Uncharacterised protein [Mycobacteroides abscessus subsp. abscessus]SLL09718.1 Uncharacterised protein [Mycobacteroides abscessus subsp. abscessus]
MTTIYQSRRDTKVLASLVIATTVGLSVVGCSTHPTTTGSNGTGTISTTAAHEMVDVSAVWATHPMPDCPRVIVGNQPAPVGLELPSNETVARQLAGVRSPGSESWVREKLGWVTMWLAQTRAGIIDHPESPSVHATVTRFDQYVEHIRLELSSGQDIPDSDLDGRFPEGCI